MEQTDNDWIEISLVCDKSDKHLTAYDSYNAECASKFIKSLEFANISDQHSSTNILKFDIGNDLQKHQMLDRSHYRLHEQSYSSRAKIENEYFSGKFDERLYVDLRPSHGYADELEKPTRNDSKMTITIETKTPLVKKLRLRVWGYTSGEYIYLQHDGSLTLKYKTYTLRSQYEELES